MADLKWFGAHFGVGLGTGHLREPRSCTDTVLAALDLGYRHLDTARAYGNERAIGAAIERAPVPRGDLFVATKIHSRNLGSDVLREAVEASREALGVETIDLLYVHWPAHAYKPEETLPAFGSLRQDGFVRHVGMSNVTVDVLKEARRVSPGAIDAVQVEMHPLCQQADLLAYCRRHGVRLVAHTPLCRGDVFDVPELVDIGRKHGVSPPQVSLAWLVGEKGIATIPGARGAHLAENFSAPTVDLDSDDVRRIESIDRQRRYVDYEFAPWATNGND